MDSQELIDILDGEFKDKSLSTSIVNTINKRSYIGFLMTNLREGLFDFVKSVLKLTSNIEVFKTLLSENINSLVHTGLFCEESGKIVLELHSVVGKTGIRQNSSLALITLVYHHGLMFPSNGGLSLGYLKHYQFSHLVIDKCCFYTRDESSVVKKYINNREDDRSKILKYAVEHDCVNIVKKLILKQKVNHLSTIKMSIDIFIEFLNNQQIHSDNLKSAIIFECFHHNRWDMLPFIMINFKLDHNDWSYIKLFFENGKLTLPFIQTFFHLIYVYKIPLYNIMFQDPILCTQEIANFLSVKGYNLFYKFSIISEQELDLEYNLCTLFYHYLKGSYNEIVNIIYHRNGYRCKRLENERALFLQLYQTKLIKWDDTLITEYQNFDIYLNGIFDQFLIMEKALMEFSSLVELNNYDIKNNMMILRCLNSLIDLLGKINLSYLQNEYKYMYDIVQYKFFEIYPKICEQIGVETTWVKPFNPTDLDNLIALNLTSCICNKKVDLDKIKMYIETVKDDNLKEYIKTSIDNFVPIDDIIDTLV